MRALQWSAPFFGLVKNGAIPDYPIRQLALLFANLVVALIAATGRPFGTHLT